MQNGELRIHEVDKDELVTLAGCVRARWPAGGGLERGLCKYHHPNPESTSIILHSAFSTHSCRGTLLFRTAQGRNRWRGCGARGFLWKSGFCRAWAVGDVAKGQSVGHAEHLKSRAVELSGAALQAGQFEA